MNRYHLVASFNKEQHAFEYQIIPEISTIKVLLPMQTSNGNFRYGLQTMISELQRVNSVC